MSYCIIKSETEHALVVAAQCVVRLLASTNKLTKENFFSQCEDLFAMKLMSIKGLEMDPLDVASYTQLAMNVVAQTAYSDRTVARSIILNSGMKMGQASLSNVMKKIFSDLKAYQGTEGLKNVGTYLIDKGIIQVNKSVFEGITPLNMLSYKAGDVVFYNNALYQVAEINIPASSSYVVQSMTLNKYNLKGEVTDTTITLTPDQWNFTKVNASTEVVENLLKTQESQSAQDVDDTIVQISNSAINLSKNLTEIINASSDPKEAVKVLDPLFEKRKKLIALRDKISLYNDLLELYDKDVQPQITESVAELFESNPELANIGTQQLYSQYLEQIFPNSKVKDIVYHGSDTKFEGFLEDNLNYFGTQAIAKGYGKNLYPVVIEINKPYYEDGGNLSNQSYEDLYNKLDESGSDGFISNGKNLFIPKTEEQIHMLGGKQDIEGFKEFVSNKSNQVENIEAQAVKWNYKKAGKNLAIGDVVEVVYSESTKPQYPYFLNFVVDGVPGGGPRMNSALDPYILKTLSEGQRVFVEITDVMTEGTDKEKGYKFKIKYTQPYTTSTSGITKQELEEINKTIAERNRKADELAKMDKAVAKTGTPAPSITEQPPLQNLTPAQRDKFVDIWKAAVRTFFADHDFEATYGNARDAREPIAGKKFAYGVKRMILTEVFKQKHRVEGDLTNIVIQGRRISLRLMKLSDVERYDIDNEMNSNTPVLVLVNDVDGVPLLFAENDEINTYEIVNRNTGGRPAYYKLGDTSQILTKDKKLNLTNKDVNDKVQSLAKTVVGTEPFINQWGKADTRNVTMGEEVAKTTLLEEALAIEQIQEYFTNNADVDLRFNITGGSLGHIDTSYVKNTPLSKITEGSIEIADEHMAAVDPDVKEGLAYLTTGGLYGKYISIQHPGVKDRGFGETISALLFDDVKKGDHLITANERIEELKKLINITGDKKLITLFPDKSDATGMAYNVAFFDPRTFNQISSIKINPNNTVEKENAVTVGKQKIQALLDLKNKSNYPVFKLDVNKAFINGTIAVPVVTDGKLTTDNMGYREFLNRNNFQVSTIDVSATGKITRLNAYFTFELSDSSRKAMETKKEDQQTKEAEQQRVQETLQEIETKLEEAGIAPGSLKDSPEALDAYTKALLDMPDEYAKRVDQKYRNSEATAEQLRAAEEWYNNSPLKGKIPLKALFDVVNSKNRDVVAKFSQSVITLYKGSDFTDVYHEAWHAFSQMFMDKTQRASLYDEVSKQDGSFYDHRGHRVTFRSASDLQIEEYLAEQFRDYMLKGQKPVEKAPVRNSLFKRIWNALKALFGNLNAVESTYNPESNGLIKDIFEKLRIGDLTEYSYSEENAEFNDLNLTIQSWNEDSTVKDDEPNNEGSRLILEMVDLYIGEYIDMINAGMTPIQMNNYRKAKEKLDALLMSGKASTTDINKAQAAVDGYEKHMLKSNKFTGMITGNKAVLTGAYAYAYNSLKEKRDELLEAGKSETRSNKLDRIKKDIKLLNFAIQEFGDLDNIDNNNPTALRVKGVIGYHKYKTEILKEAQVKADEDYINEDKAYLKAREAFERAGNETALKDLAKTEIIYLLKTLPGYEQKSDGSWVPTYNRLGVRTLSSFQAVFNRLARELEGSPSREVMFNRLKAMGHYYPPAKDILRRLGYTLETDSMSSMNLWTNFSQTFSNPRIKLIQLTITESKGAKGDDYNFTAGEAFSADEGPIRTWKRDFNTSEPNSDDPDNFFERNQFGNYLNVERLKKRISLQDALNNPMRFFKAIGITLTRTEEIVRALEKNTDLYSPLEFYKNIMNLHNVEKKTITSLDQILKVPYMKNGERKINDISNRLKHLSILESRYSDQFSNFMVTNAEGNTQFEHSLNNSMTVVANSINEVKDYQELLNTPHLAHLDIHEYLEDGVTPNPRFNHNAQASIWLKSMFMLDVPRSDARYGQRRYHNGEKVTMKITNLSGGLIRNEADNTGDGVSSSSADEYTKLIMDVHLMLSGFPELMRHADKSTSFSVSLNGPLIGNTAINEHYVNVRDFAGKGVVADNKLVDRMVPYLIAELKRMRRLRAMAKDPLLKNQDFAYIKRGSEFTVFHDIAKISRGNLTELVESGKSIDNIINDEDLMEEVRSDILNYMSGQVKEVSDKFKEAPFLSKNLEQTFKSEGITESEIQDVALKFYTYNSWLNNVESISVLYGDLAMYNCDKEEFHKRNAGIGSTGTTYATDRYMQRFINNNLWEGSYAQVNASRLNLGDTHPYHFNGQLRTAVMEDMNVMSAYTKELQDALKDKANAYGIINEKGEIEGQNEADAQGLISFDAYRQLKVAEGTWSPQHEALYHAIVKEKHVNPEDITKFFPVIKGQYWGPLQTAGLQLTAFHKYSLFPMIPSVIKDKNMELLHDRMVKEGISYVTFKSGSKIGTITKDASVKGDKLYKENRTIADEIADLKNDEPYFTPNVIHLQYLKNQLAIHEERTGNVIFSTQLRKLVEDGLMKNGVPTDFEPDGSAEDRIAHWDALKDEDARIKKSERYALLREYEKNIVRLTDLAKEDLLKEINWVENENGELSGDIENLIDLVERELTRQDLGDHSIEYLKNKEDLSLHLSVEKIEKLLNALVVKRLVKQNVNGEPLIQVACTLLENISDTLGRNFSKPTEEELKKYGSDGLPFYRKGEKGTTAMKVKIALSGDFLNLLNATYKGKKIKNISTLNLAIKDEEWLNEGRNREMITMIGVRIPVQGLNSMEFMEVYEFLDPSAGSIIVPPTEIVTKSGADFDIDKLTVMMPNIATINGQPALFNTGKTTKTKEQLLKELDTVNVKIDNVYTKYKEEFEKTHAGETELSEEDKALFKKANKQLAEEQSTIRSLMHRKDLLRGKSGNEVELKALNRELSAAVNRKNKIQEDLQDKSQAFEEFVKISMTDKATKAGRKAELEESLKSRDQLRQELNSLSAGAIQNDILNNIKNILSLPENYNSLLTPNSTDILTKDEEGKKDNSLATKAGKINSTYTSLRNGEKTMSPTRVLEVGYNLYKHSSNRVGKETLALGAIDNTYNSLFNRIGAYMNRTSLGDIDVDMREYFKAYERYEKARDKSKISDADKRILRYTKQTILLNHNKIDGHISLSHTMDANTDPKKRHSVADVVSQMINGWVDVAKDAWIFNIQGNKEVTPVLLFMVQAGVPIEDAVYFVSNPLVREYVKEQRLAKSPYARLFDKAPSKPSLFRSAARSVILSKYLGMNNTSAIAINRAINVNLGDMTKAGDIFDSKTLVTKAENENLSKIDETDKQIFLHYLQLEDMSQSVRDLKMRTNVDTSRDTSLFAAQDRLSLLDELKEDGRLPSHLIDRLKEESPISSFFVQDFQLKLFGGLFPVRNHKTLNDFIRKNMTFDMVRDTYGDRERTIVNWKSDLVNFIFQNELRFFNPDDITHYRNREISKFVNKNVVLSNGARVSGDTIYLDLVKVRDDYRRQVFTRKGYFGAKGSVDAGLKYSAKSNLREDTFDNESEYVHYILERETLRSIYPLDENIKDSFVFRTKQEQAKTLITREKEESDDDYNKRLQGTAYELFLSDTALDRIYNHWKLFNSNDSYAHQFMNINTKFPTLWKSFKIFNTLSLNEKNGIRNLKLNDPELNGDQINIMYENLQDLTTRSKLREVLSEATDMEINEIIDFFNRFSTVAFLQSGMNNKSVYALTSFVSQDKMMTLLNEPMKRFKTLLDHPENSNTLNYLSEYNKEFASANNVQHRHRRIRGKNYNINVSMMDRDSIKNMGVRAKDHVVYPNVLTDQERQPVNVEEANIFDYLDARDIQDPGNPKVKIISPKYKKDIDEAIADLVKVMNDPSNPVPLKFREEGYFQNMRNKKNRNGEPESLQTFLYLSQQLYDNFGYINPGLVRSYTFRSMRQQQQPITDINIKLESDAAVEEFMKTCKFKP